jgi:group I intron endonuclease
MNVFFNRGVYRWLCTVTGKSYVGSSQNLRRRKNEHVCKLRANKHENPKLQHAWNKYGPEAFQWEVLAYCAVPDLLSQEQLAMNAFDAVTSGYNISLIAGAPMRGRKASAETLQRMSLSKKGKKQSAEWVENRMFAHRGAKRSAETCKRISVSQEGRIASESVLANLVAGRELLKDPEARRSACKLAWQNPDRKQKMRTEADARYQQTLAEYLKNPMLCSACDDVILPTQPKTGFVTKLKNRLHCSTACANTTRHISETQRITLAAGREICLSRIRAVQGVA